MCNKDTKYFTQVKYKTRIGLNLSFEEYIILDYLVFLNMRKYEIFTYKMAIDRFGYSKNSVKKYIQSLIAKDYILRREDSKKKELFKVDYEVMEEMQEKQEIFIIIYHEKKKEHNLIDMQFAFLSMVYSLSKNKKNKVALMGKKRYMENLSIGSDENYYETIAKLRKKRLLVKKGVSQFSLNDDLFKWFQGQEKNYRERLKSLGED